MAVIAGTGDIAPNYALDGVNGYHANHSTTYDREQYN